MLAKTCLWFMALALAFPGLVWAAPDSGAAKWGKVGGWEIRVDRSLGDGCFAVQFFERGTVVRIGFDVKNQKIYVFFGHTDWKSLEVGKVYPVRIVFDGTKSYDGELRGQRIGDDSIVFLAHRNLSSAFVKDFMERSGMQVFYRGERIANLSLANTFAAVSEVMNCQRELGAATRSSGGQGGGSDPFAASPGSRGSKDPFR